MADANPSGKKSTPVKEENTKVTYVCDKEALLKKYPKLKAVIETKAKDGWKEVVVAADGGIDCK